MKITKRKIVNTNDCKFYDSVEDLPVAVYAGAYLDVGGYVNFNWNKDNRHQDIIGLKTNTMTEHDVNGVRYIYGFEYFPGVPKSKQKKFRDYIKHLGIGEDYNNTEADDDVVEFVERAISMFDENYGLQNFGATVHIDPTSKNHIVGVMAGIFAEWSSNARMSFTLIKKMYKDVRFDVDKAYDELIDAGVDEAEAQYLVDVAVRRFNGLKKSGKLFEMKNFMPRELRRGFSEYLRFASPKDEWAYRQLQDVDVLVYDDFLTSGATIEEVLRYLKSINSNNRLTVFILIKQ